MRKLKTFIDNLLAKIGEKIFIHYVERNSIDKNSPIGLSGCLLEIIVFGIIGYIIYRLFFS